MFCRWGRVAPLVALGLTWSPPAGAISAPTVYDNHQSYPLGSRAAAMGGAYTALGCDEAAIHYNPASLGCAGASRLELAANAYLIQALSVPDAFGAGNDVDAINFHSLPSIAGGVRILSEGDENGDNRWVFGFSVAVPQSLVLRVDPAQPELASALTTAVVDNIIAADLGVGWQINRHVSIGLTLGGALRTFDSELTLLSTEAARAICAADVTCLPFFQETVDARALAVGLRAKAGVRVVPTEGLSLGLALASPSIDVFGSSSLTTNFTYAVPDDMGTVFYDALALRYEGSSNLSMPFRMALGIAYQTGPVTLSLDVSLNFPHSVETIDDLEQIVVQGADPLPQEAVDASALVHERTWQPNVNLGAEFAIADPVVLAVGAFTDLSSVDNEGVPEPDREDKVHMFGGTLGLGFTGKRARGWFGLSFEYGRADTKVLPGSLTLGDLASGVNFTGDSTVTRWTLAGFIGSSYSFFEGDDEEEPAPKAKAKSRR